MGFTASRKRLLLVAGLVVLLVAGGLVMWAAVPEHCICSKSFEVIEVGMTEHDVEGLLGVPAGDYTTKPFMFVDDGTDIREEVAREWWGDEGIVTIWFDAKGKVAAKRFLRAVSVDEGPLDKLRRLLHL